MVRVRVRVSGLGVDRREERRMKCLYVLQTPAKREKRPHAAALFNRLTLQVKSASGAGVDDARMMQTGVPAAALGVACV